LTPMPGAPKKADNFIVISFLNLSRLSDSNRRPHPYHGCALPAELRRHKYTIKQSDQNTA
jgi:hypothetical protein